MILDEQSLSYAELLHASQRVSEHLIEECDVQRGDIVGQCVERSIEMVIGMMAILLSGASYCPLSSDQPVSRLQSLIEQVRCRCLLVHARTKSLIISAKIVDLEAILFSSSSKRSFDEIRDVHIDSMVYVIFTSGSTGRPKMVPISHLNFVTCLNGLVDCEIMERNETVVQITPVTSDIHIHETLRTLCLGGSISLLRPLGNVDMAYLSSLIDRDEITCLITVPTLLISLVQYLQSSSSHRFNRLRRVCSIGESLRPSTASQWLDCLSPNARLYHLYGPTECIFTSTYHHVTREDLQFNSLPIGRLLTGYQCSIVDRFLQPILFGHQTGELLIGGKAVFARYLHRPDLTREAFVEKDQIFYQTGDLVRLDVNSRMLFYGGRNDFQLKLRGQRIEAAEIEIVILNTSTHISNVLVVKVIYEHQEHLVAYLQTKARLDADLLREECSKHLPLYMIPSLFVLIDRFPLNPNGKIDRSALPSPHFSSQTTNEGEEPPQTEMERRVASIWCDVLHLDSIRSTKKSFFQLGGNSLLLIRLHQTYQSIFQQSLNIADLFRRTTIKDHLQLIESHRIGKDPRWQSLNVTEGPASFAQTRLYLDERLRFGNGSETVAIYHIPIVLEVVQTPVSISRLERALHQVIVKHKALRTRLLFDENEGEVRQEIVDYSSLKIIVTTVDETNDLNAIVYNEETNTTLLDLSAGRVFRCHAVRRSTSTEDDLLMSSDVLIFNFHHASFDDLRSMCSSPIFSVLIPLVNPSVLVCSITLIIRHSKRR